MIKCLSTPSFLFLFSLLSSTYLSKHFLLLSLALCVILNEVPFFKPAIIQFLAKFSSYIIFDGGGGVGVEGIEGVEGNGSSAEVFKGGSLVVDISGVVE
jgi:hypothetical protein